ncbi:hypothetical protein L1987_22815 [Smallanthus sonchifolius]|uniref:Uncharacterized protein n=1 Tax=Smallanthus sonchifolius TaxID=185202 RepID=A0ACB9IGG7_9ASTR|nr:hypothetical protein L1987_22815 [Smallanthus sonchifolius]
MSLRVLSGKSIINKLNPSFPVINSLKWRTQTSWSSSNPIFITPPSTNLIITSCTPIHKAKDHVTREAPGVTTSEWDKLPKGWFWFRKWHSEDVANIFWYTAIHVLSVCAPFMFNWGALRVAVGLSFLTGFGVTLGYHRLLCHRSFKLPKWLEYFFVYCGAHAFQCGEYSKVPELKAQWFYTFLHDTYYWHPAALAALLYLHGGLCYLSWGMGMRGVVVHHFASLASYVSHIWGERPWNTQDTSTNNWWVAMLTLGEGWHNNHHAFPRSARHGLEWWQFDLT